MTLAPFDYAELESDLEVTKRRKLLDAATAKVVATIRALESEVFQFAADNDWAIQDISVETRTFVEGGCLFVEASITGPGDPNPTTYTRSELCLTGLPEGYGQQKGGSK